MKTVALASLFVFGLGGCRANLSTSSESSDSEVSRPAELGVSSLNRDLPCDEKVLSPEPLRRLSHREYARTVEGLFPGLPLDLPDLAPDRAVHGYENFASQLNPSELLVEQYFDSAFQVAEAVVARGSEFLPCDPVTGDDACRDAFFGAFATEIFRRPLNSGERERFGAYFEEKRTAISFRGAVQLTLASMLISPQFLYRLELESPGGIDTPLNDYDMATRLSYFLWQTLPDEELLLAAANGELRTEEQIVAQAQRMLKDPRAEAAFVDFHRQWLALDKILAAKKEPTLFPSFTEELGREIFEESSRFVGSIFRSASPTLESLLTSTAAELTPATGALYGVPVSSDGVSTVELPSDERSGILTRAAFTAGFAKSTNGSPPLRGVAVLDRILCMHPPAPPANVDTSVAQDPTKPKTNRQIFEAKTSSDACKGCHVQIDGIGFTFENFDSIGQYRTTDNGEPVDASGKLVGTDNDGAVADAMELSGLLAESDTAEYCNAVQWYRYAFGREEQPADWCRTDPLFEALDSSGGDLKQLLLKVVRSPQFLHRPPAAVAVAP